MRRTRPSLHASVFVSLVGVATGARLIAGCSGGKGETTGSGGSGGAESDGSTVGATDGGGSGGGGAAGATDAAGATEGGSATAAGNSCDDVPADARVPVWIADPHYCLIRYASVPRARGITFAPNGDLFVATAAGQVIVLHDTNRDGV